MSTLRCSVTHVHEPSWRKERLLEPAAWSALDVFDASLWKTQLRVLEQARQPPVVGGLVRQLEVVRSVVGAVGLPVTVKLTSFYASVPAFVRSLEQAGARGVAVFNRFYQPDISIAVCSRRPRRSYYSGSMSLR